MAFVQEARWCFSGRRRMGNAMMPLGGSDQFSVFGVQSIAEAGCHVMGFGSVDHGISHSHPQLFDWLASDLDNRSIPDSPLDSEANLDDEFWYEQGVRVRRSLVLNRLGDDALWMLDPETHTISGEWAGGRFSAWEPGMNWYAESFARLMIAARATFLEIRRPG